MALNPAQLYVNYFSPIVEGKDQRSQIEERSLLYFNFFANFVGLYSLFKWIKFDNQPLLITSLIVLFVCVGSSVAIKHKAPIQLITNLVLLGFSSHAINIILHTGGLLSPHILWIPALVLAAFLLSRGMMTHAWLACAGLFLIWLINAHLKNTALPSVNMPEAAWTREVITGYLLPFVLIWVVQSHIINITKRSLFDAEESRLEVETRSIQIEEQSSQLEDVIKSTSVTAQTLFTDAELLKETAAVFNSESEQLNLGASQQVTLSQQNIDVLQELLKDSNNNAEDVQNIRELTTLSRDRAHESRGDMISTNQAMEHIQSSYEEIYKTVSVITDIAKKTNLLALNAAIEAARAGEQGRGFSIVADEVRNLSQLCNESAEDIRIVLDNSKQVVEDGSNSLEKTSHNLQAIIEDVEKTSDNIVNVADTVMRQKQEVNTLSQLGEQVLFIAKENQQRASGFQQQTDNMQHLASELSDLSELLKNALNKS